MPLYTPPPQPLGTDDSPSFAGLTVIPDDLGVGIETPAEKLHVIGNVQIGDAETETKGYRLRTSGSSLDLDFHSAALIISGFDGPGYTGTQRNKFVLKVAEDTSQLVGDWEISPTPFGMPHHWLGSGALNGEARFNDQQTDSDFYVRSTGDPNLIRTDAANDTVQIGAETAADGAKFYVDGKISTSGELEVNGALNHDGSMLGFYGVAPVAQSPAYTATNVTTTRALDAGAATTGDVANVLGTLINDLKAMGIIG